MPFEEKRLPPALVDIDATRAAAASDIGALVPLDVAAETPVERAEVPPRSEGSESTSDARVDRRRESSSRQISLLTSCLKLRWSFGFASPAMSLALAFRFRPGRIALCTARMSFVTDFRGTRDEAARHQRQGCFFALTLL
jgi:hypothetical protein